MFMRVATSESHPRCGGFDVGLVETREQAKHTKRSSTAVSVSTILEHREREADPMKRFSDLPSIGPESESPDKSIMARPRPHVNRRERKRNAWLPRWISWGFPGAGRCLALSAGAKCRRSPTLPSVACGGRTGR